MTPDLRPFFDEDVDARLGHEVDGVLGAPVHLGVAALTPVSAGLRNGQSLHARVARYSAPVGVWYGAITVNPAQVFAD